MSYCLDTDVTDIPDRLLYLDLEWTYKAVDNGTARDRDW